MLFYSLLCSFIFLSLCDGIQDKLEKLSIIMKDNYYCQGTCIENLNKTFHEVFSVIRSDDYDEGIHKAVGLEIKARFHKYGLQTSIHKFTRKGHKGRNIIGISPGRYRGTKKDKILFIGAHYDTTSKGIGTDDNSSGTVALLEVARRLLEYKNKLNHTVFFVAFDLEEKGIFGSTAYVNNVFIPNELKNAKFLGAYIIDMMLNFDDENNTQTLENTSFKDKSLIAEMELNGWKGNFLSVWTRKSYDTKLWEIFAKYWNKQPTSNKYKLYKISADSDEDIKGDIIRSDHASFWQYQKKDNTYMSSILPAVLLNDMATWRKKTINCYHKKCDDFHLLSEDNLGLLKHGIDALFETVVNFSLDEAYNING